MAANQRHSIYAVKIGSTTYGGIVANNISNNIEKGGEATSGKMTPEFLYVRQIRPVLDFTTLQLGTILGIATNGASAAARPWAAIGAAGLVAYAYAHVEGGGRAGNSSHKSFTINEGILVPRRLMAPHGRRASLMVEALATYDGTNNPVVIAEGVTPGSPAAHAEEFGLASATVGNIALPNKTDVTIDFGIRAEVISTDGDIYPTFVSVVEFSPVITIRGISMAWWSSSGFGYPAANATLAQTTLSFRRFAQGGAYQADASTVHLTVSMAGMVTVEEMTGPEGGGPREITLTLTGRDDGTNAPMVITPSAALA